VRFVRSTSLEASRSLALHRPADLVFIDADHGYDAVRQDLLSWAPKIAPGGVLAFHDSRRCAARPDLAPDTAGPVRLMDELRSGLFGAWRIVAEADSVTAVSPGDGAGWS
jgi:predicted O-methyltransferase YrrM